MTREEIAETLLGTMMPETRKLWSYSFGSATALVEIIFRPKSFVMILDVGKIAACFQEPFRKISWQQEVGDGPDSPSIVIEGGVGGKLVQAVFILRDAEG
ncbi:hypothetical protein J8F10_22190 [Gemmata sp. G18]|uniref:Uncharacterized protein n=1 Tax=Gemmata palustris TaxID=2822762 RepID=A0ABS5BW88_9BACT|nr:hypothetical protein [Gemmata palustris]MBP3957974.1 hypothetical protein [Gemmata palustris]